MHGVRGTAHRDAADADECHDSDWKVGSPHTGDTPDTEMPLALAREAGTGNKPHHTSARKSLRDFTVSVPLAQEI